MISDAATHRIPIMMPDLGTGSERIRVCAWLVDVGQTIVAGDRVAQVLIPGVTFDITSTQTGELVEVTRPVDAWVSPGDVLGWIAPEAPAEST